MAGDQPRILDDTTPPFGSIGQDQTREIVRQAIDAMKEHRHDDAEVKALDRLASEFERLASQENPKVPSE